MRFGSEKRHIRKRFRWGMGLLVLFAGVVYFGAGCAKNGPLPGETSQSKAVTTASGLQYQVIKEGTGNAAQPGKMVSVNYTGWLLDGTKFDSSVDRGQPFQFPLGMGRVIHGWDEGVAGMKIGEKRKLIIPSDLGYGPNGAPPTIPPNATLVFDVELLGVQ